MPYFMYMRGKTKMEQIKNKIFFELHFLEENKNGI